MVSRSWFSCCLVFAVAGCSLLVDIDEDDYTGGSVGDGDGDGDAVGVAGDSGDGDGSGSGGGDGDGDGSGGATGGLGGATSGGGGSGGQETGGTGGTSIEDPEPVHYYPLDGNGEDAVGSADATVTDPDGWVNSGAIRGGAYEVSDTSDQAYLGMPSNVIMDSPFTICWWLFPTTEGFVSLGGKTTYGQAGRGWELLTDDTNVPRVRFGGDAAGDFRFSEASLPDGQWVHLTFAYEQDANGPEDRFKLYIDGQRVEEDMNALQFEGDNDSAELRFGDQVGLGGSGIQPYSGFVDEVRIYDQYLSDEEVQAIYEMDAPQ